MEHRHCRYFVAVAEELHFGRAARRLNISQPPLSQQIRSLEEELGVELLRRTKRHVELTHAGRVFLERARMLLSDAQDAALAAKRASLGQVGRLTIGFLQAATYRLLPGMLRAFSGHAPEVELVLREMTGTAQVPALVAGTIDIGILRPPVSNTLLNVRVLAREPLVVALPKDHRFAGHRLLRLADLSREQFVMYTPALSPLYGQVMGACLAAGFTPKVTQHATMIMTLVGLVRGGMGIALLPESTSIVRIDGVRYIPLGEKNLMAEIAMAWRVNDDSPLTRTFLQVVSSQGTREEPANQR
jgi:DNA-binding transcriptional LysR family regulator